MKMLMILIDQEKREELEVFLSRSGVEGYTELEATGVGSSGPRYGSGAFPKTSAVVFSVVDEETLALLQQRLDAFCESCGEELKMIAWGVDRLR
jgi:nitrogen regulatory protein PII